MIHPLREALDRTLLLIRDELVPEVEDSTLIAALTDTEVVLTADARNLASHSAQSAYVTAALLCARSGHRVYLAAPDVPLIGAQPPLKGNRLVSALLEIGTDLLPGIGFSAYAPRADAGLAVCFGDSATRFRAVRTVAINATAWSARIGSVGDAGRWAEQYWPLGALAAGCLASAEAFKVAMHQLRRYAKDEMLFDALFAFTADLEFALAPPSSPRVTDLGNFDLISGGAITNAVLYPLARLPKVRGRARVVEPEVGDLSNLNRYKLLRRSDVGARKGDILKRSMPADLELEAIPGRYEGSGMVELGDFAPHVLVGVDDIPTRWKVQQEGPQWLGIGATTHWAAMASHHRLGSGCARCLHPRDDPGAGPIPTLAPVSFLAGLMLAAYFLRTVGGENIEAREQYTYLSPLRPEQPWRSPVAVRRDCPVCQHPGGAMAA